MPLYTEILPIQTLEEQSALTEAPASALPKATAASAAAVAPPFDVPRTANPPILSEPPASAGLTLSVASPSLPDPAPMKPLSKQVYYFHPGQSGNPSGRHKCTKEEKEAMDAIRSLDHIAVEKLESLLKSDDVSAAVKVKICELILDRTYGKVETAVRVTSVQKTVEKSESYILSLVERIRADMEDESP